jgi:hypothetical protein
VNDPRDNELSHIYKEGTWPEPSRQIDEAILSASRRAARARHPFVRRWAPPLALAATVVLTVSLVLSVYQDQPQTVSPPIPDGRSAPSVPTAEAPAEKPKSVPAPQSAPAPAPKPAPAAPAVALKKEAPQATRADQTRREIQENLRERYQSSPPQELQPEARPEPMRAPLRANEAPSPSPAQSAPRAAVGGAEGAISIRRTDVPERSPQAWLEDIRRLKAQGKPEEAGRELAEFRKRYPDYALPEDLR